MRREEYEEVKRLKREVGEVRRANEILKTASAFFPAQLTGRPDDDRLYWRIKGAFRGRADLPDTGG